jgi:hypothetical protein
MVRPLPQPHETDVQICRTCHVVKPWSHFNRNAEMKSGYSSRCKECDSKAWTAKPGRPRTGPRKYAEPAEKLCRGCGQVLPIDEFRVRHERNNGRRPRCIGCEQKAHATWRDRNPGDSRRRNLRSKYGITEAEYFDLLEQQGGGCGICGSSESRWATSPWLHVDHNHQTGAVRGLLCHTCNIAVGCVEGIDMDIERLAMWVRK